MHKTLRILLSIVLLPVWLPMIFGLIGTMWLASRIARTDRKRAAWLLLRLATFMRRMPNSKPRSKRGLGASFVAPALLLQGAPWKHMQQRLDVSASIAHTAFEFYFAEQRWDQALEAAQAWCEQTQSAVADCADEMREFFEQHGVDLSRPARIELWMQHSKAQEAAWEANPHGKRPGIFNAAQRKPPRFVRFLDYYDSHLALYATHWIATRDPTATPIKRELESYKAALNWMGSAQFRVSDASLELIGMSATDLAAIRRLAMGQ